MRLCFFTGLLLYIISLAISTWLVLSHTSLELAAASVFLFASLLLQLIAFFNATALQYTGGFVGMWRRLMELYLQGYAHRGSPLTLLSIACGFGWGVCTAIGVWRTCAKPSSAHGNKT